MRTPLTAVKMRVSTDTVEPLQRAAFWSDFVCSKLVEAECTLGAERRFRGTIERLQLSEMSVSHIAADAQRVVRNKSHLARASDAQFVVMLQRAGQCVVQQGGRRVVLQPGDLAFYPSTEVSDLQFDSAFQQIVVVVAAPLMRHAVEAVDGMGLRHVQAGHPGSHCVGFLADTLLSQAEGLGWDACCHLGLSLLHALAAAAGKYQALARHDGRTLQYYHLARIQSFIRAHLSNPALDVPMVAGALRLSVSSVHRIFADQACGVAAFMWQERLAACRRDLEDAAQCNSRLGEVAYRWGFGDAMHFSHAFKRVYGATPREWRRLHTCQTAASAVVEGGIT